MSSGWWTIGKWSGAPIRLHWSVIVGALFFGGYNFVPAFWLGFVLLILVHEFGHALLVRRYRLGLLEIAVHGLGGYCRHAPAYTREQEAVIAWGGVLAQGVLYASVVLANALLGPPQSRPVAQLYSVFTYTNLWVMLINLIPIEPLDGAKAWPLVGMLWRRLREKSAPRARRSATPDEEARQLVRDLLDRNTKSKPDA